MNRIGALGVVPRMSKRSRHANRAMTTVKMSLSRMLFGLLALSLPASSQSPEIEPVRALKQVVQTSEVQVSQLVANSGWQPIYVQTVEVQAGDLLRLVGGTQLTVDGVTELGQQMRLTVDGQTIGSVAAEVNTQPGSHHLPMTVTGLYKASESGTITVILEGSAFHSSGNYLLTVDQQGEIKTGSLLVETYRSYPDLQAAWDDQALLLNDVHHPTASSETIWGLVPYIQKALSSVTLPVNSGDILRLSAQAVAFPSFGLEQFTGVLTAQDKPVSPYGGQNAIYPENPMAPMLLEGYTKSDIDGKLLLEHRLYGAFGHGLTLIPETPRFEVAHFATYGRSLVDVSQDQISTSAFVADGSTVEIWSREVTLDEGDLVRAMASFQLGPPSAPNQIDCRLILEIEGPDGTEQSMSAKSLYGVKSMVPILSFATKRASSAGTYRISAKLNGISAVSPVTVNLDAPRSQVQLLHFGLPKGQKQAKPPVESP